MQITEGKLSFEFQQSWNAIKFDEHVDYNRFKNSLVENKGVDILAIHSDKLLFIEIKDFREHTYDASTIPRLENYAEDLCIEVAQKVKCSIACIAGACKTSTNDSLMWKNVLKYFIDNKDIFVVTWIEETFSEYYNNSATYQKKKKESS